MGEQSRMTFYQKRRPQYKKSYCTFSKIYHSVIHMAANLDFKIYELFFYKWICACWMTAVWPDATLCNVRFFTADIWTPWAPSTSVTCNVCSNIFCLQQTKMLLLTAAENRIVVSRCYRRHLIGIYHLQIQVRNLMLEGFIHTTWYLLLF